MKASELPNERDRKAAEQSERRNRVRTYKDQPIQRKEAVPKYYDDEP